MNINIKGEDVQIPCYEKVIGPFILMSVKPSWAIKLVLGRKPIELRKRFRLQTPWVFVHATNPLGMVIGEFEIDRVQKESPGRLLSAQLLKDACVTVDEYWWYFDDAPNANAIHVKNPMWYDKPLILKDFGKKRPPYSYDYVGRPEGLDENRPCWIEKAIKLGLLDEEAQEIIKTTRE